MKIFWFSITFNFSCNQIENDDRKKTFFCSSLFFVAYFPFFLRQFLSKVTCASEFGKFALLYRLYQRLSTFTVDCTAWYRMKWKMEWNENFGVEYGRCPNGMEYFKNGIEDYRPYFRISSILDFAYGIYRKIYTDSGQYRRWSK